MTIDLTAIRERAALVERKTETIELAQEQSVSMLFATRDRAHLLALVDRQAALLRELSTIAEEAREACARRSFRLGLGDNCDHCVRLASIHARIEAARDLDGDARGGGQP